MRTSYVDSLPTSDVWSLLYSSLLSTMNVHSRVNNNNNIITTMLKPHDGMLQPHDGMLKPHDGMLQSHDGCCNHMMGCCNHMMGCYNHMMGCCNHMMGCCNHMMGCYNDIIFTDCLCLSSKTAASGTPAQEREVQKLSEFGVQDPASMSGTFG